MRMSIYQYGSSLEDDGDHFECSSMEDDGDQFECSNCSDNTDFIDSYCFNIYPEDEDIQTLHEVVAGLDTINLSVSTSDDTPLTPRIMDRFAAQICTSWKRFARITELFLEAELDDIDENSSSMYEKCYQMIRLWLAKSQEEVTVAMVISVLLTIERNTVANTDMANEVIKYTIDNGEEIRKMKVHRHHALRDMNNEFVNMKKSLRKVQYIDDNYDKITCDSEMQLDLAIFDEGVRDFNVLTRTEVRWIVFV